jgi:hypothetical protein
MAIEFQDNSIKVISALQDECIAFLYEAGESLAGQVADNSRVGSGQLKGSWQNRVDEGELKATVGSPLENAIWEEFGTGEYALQGNGRKGGWYYQDDSGKWHHTYGKAPSRAFHNAYVTMKPAIINRAKQIGGKMS